MKKYIKELRNGNCINFDDAPHLANKEGFIVIGEDGEPIGGPAAAAEEITEVKTDTQRLLAIADAITAIDPATFTKPTGGRPAMPKVAAVSAMVGYTVTAAEIESAMQFMG
jgi:hypothetical protein